MYPLVTVPPALLSPSFPGYPPQAKYFGKEFVSCLEDYPIFIMDDDIKPSPINILRFLPWTKKGICSRWSAKYIMDLIRPEKDNTEIVSRPRNIRFRANNDIFDEERWLEIIGKIILEYPNITYPYFLPTFDTCVRRCLAPIPNYTLEEQCILDIAKHDLKNINRINCVDRFFYYYRISILGNNIEISNLLLKEIISRLLPIREIMLCLPKELYHYICRMF